jgi:aminopeptidase N
MLTTHYSPDGSVTTEFETTPPMSTHVVAFHVSDFPHVTNALPRQIPQRVFARSNAINATNLVLETGELLINAISDYVDVEYPLPKLDQIAVPGYCTIQKYHFYGDSKNILFLVFPLVQWKIGDLLLMRKCI